MERPRPDQGKMGDLERQTVQSVPRTAILMAIFPPQRSHVVAIRDIFTLCVI